MSRKRCDAPANSMLPWYVNGSLEGNEEAGVARHVAACEICAAEAEILSRMARELEGPDSAVAASAPSGAERAAPRLAYAAAALLLVPAALGVWWALLGFPGIARDDATAEIHLPRPRRAESLRSAWVLTLPQVTRADGSAPSFVVREGAEEAVVVFTPPVNPDAEFSVELRGPEGRVLIRRDGGLLLDELGRSTLAAPASLLGAGGDYALVVTERPAAGTERQYEYRFRIATGSPREVR